MPKSKVWTSEEHARVSCSMVRFGKDAHVLTRFGFTQLLVALIKTGKPKIDTNEIAAFLNNGRTAGAVYFEIRRIKLSVEGTKKRTAAVAVKRSRDDDEEEDELPSPPQTPVKAEPRPVRAIKPSAAKRRYDEVVESGFWDDDSDDDDQRTPPAKRAKGRVKVENDGAKLDAGNVDVAEADFDEDLSSDGASS